MPSPTGETKLLPSVVSFFNMLFLFSSDSSKLLQVNVLSYAALLPACTLNSSAGVRLVCQAYRNKAHRVLGLRRGEEWILNKPNRLQPVLNVATYIQSEVWVMQAIEQPGVLQEMKVSNKDTLDSLSHKWLKYKCLSRTTAMQRQLYSNGDPMQECKP